MCIYTQQLDSLENELATTEQDDPRYVEIAGMIESIIMLIMLSVNHHHPGHNIPHVYNLNTCCQCCVLDNRQTCLELWEEMHTSKNSTITPDLYQQVVDEINEFYLTHPVTDHYIPEEMNRINLMVLGGRFGKSD